MAWKIELDRAAVRELGKLDQQTARRILAFLHSRVATLDDPRSIGEALKGSKLGEFWKYRIGDYRVIARIEGGRIELTYGFVEAARTSPVSIQNESALRYEVPPHIWESGMSIAAWVEEIRTTLT